MTAPASKMDLDLTRENESLRAQLAEAQELIRAIQAGEVDAVVVSGPEGEQVFTLKGAEHAYRVLVEAMNEGAATLSSDGTVLYCNRRLADIVGLSLERIIGNAVETLIGPASLSTFHALLVNAMGGQSDKAELELQAADGSNLPAYVSVRQMEACEPAVVCMVVTDLTEHRRRDDLIAAGTLARSILESAAEAIAVCDCDGKIIIANPALRRLCGFNPVFQLFDSALPLAIKRGSTESKRFSVFEALAGNDFRVREVSFVRPDGTALTLLLSSAQVVVPLGGAGCVLMLTDITQRMRDEEELRKTRDTLQAVLDSAPAGILVADHTGRILFASATAERILGSKSIVDAYGIRRGFELSNPDGSLIPSGHRPLALALAGGVVTDTEMLVTREDKTHAFILASATPLRNAQGKVWGAVAVFRDITDRKRTEQLLIHSEKLAATGRLAATIAHEINNPLMSVSNLVYLMQSEPALDRMREYAGLAAAELGRVAHITRQTLAFYRESTSPEQIDLAALLDELSRVYAREFESRGIVFEKVCAPASPVCAFRGEMRQIFCNLIQNAIDVLPPSGRLRVHVVSNNHSQPASVSVFVSDTGPGIAPSIANHLFQPFVTSKGSKGTGLGLWVAKDLVEKNGGHIRVRTRCTPGNSGTVFCVFIPGCGPGPGAEKSVDNTLHAL